MSLKAFFNPLYMYARMQETDNKKPGVKRAGSKGFLES
jgi:hypothetical protein